MTVAEILEIDLAFGSGCYPAFNDQINIRTAAKMENCWNMLRITYYADVSRLYYVGI